VMTFSLMPLGTLPLGWITDEVGAPRAIGGGGIIVALFTVAMALLLPGLRRLK
jgi:hypothetical protein